MVTGFLGRGDREPLQSNPTWNSLAGYVFWFYLRSISLLIGGHHVTRSLNKAEAKSSGLTLIISSPHFAFCIMILHDMISFHLILLQFSLCAVPRLPGTASRKEEQQKQMAEKERLMKIPPQDRVEQR